MRVRFLEVYCEEPSAQLAVRSLLGRVLEETEASFEVYSFNGKSDLLAKLPQRLDGYSRWLPDDHKILILVDRDRQECLELKAHLAATIRQANLELHSARRRRSGQVLPRIVVEELESWFLGDGAAIRAAYPKVSPHFGKKAKFRQPDEIDGAWEALERVLQAKGYFRSGFRKREAARAISGHMDPARNQSKSFQVFRDGVLDLVR